MNKFNFWQHALSVRLYGQQNLERGLAGMEYSIELEPSFIQSFVAAAELCLKHNSPKRAIKYITKAYKLNKVTNTTNFKNSKNLFQQSF